MRAATDSESLLALTGAAISMELGLLVGSLAGGASPAVTGAVLGAFHVGYLCADRVATWPYRRVRLGAAIGAIAIPIAFMTMGPLASVPAVVVMSTGVQALRRQYKRVATRHVSAKHTVKALGMALGGAAAWHLGFSAIALVTATLVLLTPEPSHVQELRSPRTSIRKSTQRLLLGTEFTHHAHYFLYCYTFWRLDPFVAVSLVGPLFVLGWLAYFLAESVIGRRSRFAPLQMSVGHLLGASCLVGMLVSSRLWWLMLMWFLTGVGGGTAYMLGRGPQATRREGAEDLGHVTGAVLGGLLATWTVQMSIATAAIVAVLTAALAFSLSCADLTERKEQ